MLIGGRGRGGTQYRETQWETEKGERSKRKERKGKGLERKWNRTENKKRLSVVRQVVLQQVSLVS